MQKVKKTIKEKPLLFKVVKVFSDNRLSTVAGAWVFYFLTAVIPLVFLLITAFGVFGVELSMDLVSRLPNEFRLAGESIVYTAQKASKGATLLFIITAIYSCIRLLNQMSKDGDFLYNEKSLRKRGLNRRMWAFFSLVLLFSLFFLVGLIVIFGNQLFAFSYLMKGVRKLISALIFCLVIISFSYLIIVLLNFFISPIKLRFSEVGLGALVSLFIIVFGTIGFSVYIRFFNSYNAFYGSLAGVIIFLLWAYILMLSMVVGVIVNASIYKHKIKNKNQIKILQ